MALASPSIANELAINIVGLFKDKIIISDETTKQKVMKVGETTKSGYTLITADSSGATFKSASGKIVKANLSSRISTTFNQSTEISELIELNENNQYIVNVIINDNEPTTSLIDTGANLVTLSGNTASYLGIDYKNEDTKVSVSTASDDTFGYRVTLRSVALGDIKLFDIDAIVIEGEEPEVILIGMSFLKDLELEYADNQLNITLPLGE